MKKLIAILTLCSLAVVGTAHATPIKWTLSGVTLSDATNVTGSFYYDATSNAYTNWSLATEAGSLSGFTYDTSSSSSLGLSGPTEFLLVKNDYGRYLNLNLVGALTSAGGTVPLELATAFTNFGTGSWECNNCGTFRWVTGGSVTSTDVPEPASIALVGAALIGLGLSRSRRKRV